MDITIVSINPTFVEHEGFYYLEHEGEFYKGCTRCGGEGHYSYNGEHSRCYTCDDTSAKLGVQLADKQAAEKWCHGRAMAKARRERAAEAKRLAVIAAMEANQQALLKEDPEVYEYLMGVVIEDDTQYLYSTYDEWAQAQAYEQPGVRLEKDTFIRSMAETLRWATPNKPFTPKMIAAVRASMERKATAAAEAAKHPVPTGRQVVTGTIVGAKVKESDYGTAYKVVVQADAGYRVYVSLPKAQTESALDDFNDWICTEDPARHTLTQAMWLTGTTDNSYPGVKGRRISFTATLTQSDDDAAFGFGSRPTKGAWL